MKMMMKGTKWKLLVIMRKMKMVKLDPSDFPLPGDQTLSTKKRKCNGSDENLGHHRKSKRLKAKADPAVKKLICSHCKRILPTRPDFNKHIEEAHPELSKKRSATVGRAGFKCNSCQMTLKKNRNMKNI